MPTSKFELIQAFMAMNEETRSEIIKQRFDSLAYEAQLRNLSDQQYTLPKKKLDKTL